MEDICRFCLANSSIGMRDFLKDPDILQKTTTCLSIEIVASSYLPQQICLDCTDKLEDLYKFYEQIVASQSLLQNHLNNGLQELNDFYLSLKTIKVEEPWLEKEGIFVITPESGDCEKYEDTENKVIMKSETEESKIIKTETTISEILQNNEVVSSDDETLASVKKTKDYGDLNTLEDDGEENIVDSYAENDNTDSYEFNFETEENEQPIFPKTAETKHKCLTCFKLYDTQKLLVKHYENDHRHNKIDKDNLKKHYKSVKSADGTVSFKCITCDKIYKSRRDMNRHLIYTHTEERPFLCKICGRAYKTSYELVLHDRAHNKPKYVCKYNCGYKTCYPGPLHEHELRHRKEFKYRCECGKGFNIRTWYEQHKNIHLGLRPFKCTICGASFHMEKYLTNHRIYRHPHSQTEKRYQCIHCSLPFDTKRALSEHLKVHRPEPLNPLCDLCGKVLKSMDALNLHVKSHFGDNPFKCTRCPKSFMRKFTLDRHEESHDQIRLHSCNDCDKRFMQRSTLLRHMRSKHGHPTFLQTPKEKKQVNTKMKKIESVDNCI